MADEEGGRRWIGWPTLLAGLGGLTAVITAIIAYIDQGASLNDAVQSNTRSITRDERALEKLEDRLDRDEITTEQTRQHVDDLQREVDERGGKVK